MTFQVEVSIKHTSAVRTRKPFDSSMDFNMFVKISPLSKAELTVFHWALVRSFIGMDPQMVKEVVPFSESLSACFEVAL